MSQVDDLQEGEEWASQREDEARATAKAERETLFSASRVFPSFERPRRLEMISASECRLAPNIRPHPSPGSIDEMALSIKERGVLQTVLCYDDQNAAAEKPYVLFAGQRRLRACQMLEDQWDISAPLPAIVLELLDGETEIPREEIETLMLVENIGREDLDPKVVARAVRRAIERNPGLEASAIARSLGKPAAWVRFHLRLEKGLPDEILDLLEQGNLSFKAADLLRREADRGADEETVMRHAEQLASGEQSAIGLEAELVQDPESVLHDPGRAAAKKPRSETPAASAPAKASSNGEGPDRAPAADDLDDWDETPPWSEPNATAGASKEEQLAATAQHAADENATADAYLLGMLLRDNASDEYVEGLGIAREEAWEYAQALPAQARLTQIRDLARTLAAEDEDAPERLRPATAQA